MPVSRATRRALVVRGGWEGHSPVEITDLFLPFLKDEGFTVETSASLDVYTDTGLLAATDLIVQCWTMGEITADQVRGLTGAVRAGTGFAGWHGGIVDSFRGAVDYTLLTGGQFLAHPPGFLDHTVSVVPGRAGHPVVAGLGDFAVHTEQYWVATDPATDVLATTLFPADRADGGTGGSAGGSAGGSGGAGGDGTAGGDGGDGGAGGGPVVMPAVWTRTRGAGRVFVSTIGHKADDFDVPEVRTLTERGLLWASR